MLQRGDIPAGGDIWNRGLVYRPVDDLYGFGYVVINDIETL